MGTTSDSKTAGIEILYEEPDNGYVGISWEKSINNWVIHIVCHEWSLSTYKRYKVVGERVKAILRARGIKVIYGLAEDVKAVRFNKMFGAETTGHLVEDDQGKLNILIKLEL